MHIIGIIIALGTAFFWFSRIARASRDVADAANTLSNIPRKLRFSKKAGKKGLALITSPQEAATVLMVAVAKLSRYSETHEGLISNASGSKIIDLLVTNMHITPVEADELLTQMRWLVGGLAQPDSTLAPMTNVLNAHINRSEAAELADMLMAVASTDGPAGRDQKAFIARFNERTGAYA